MSVVFDGFVVLSDTLLWIVELTELTVGLLAVAVFSEVTVVEVSNLLLVALVSVVFFA